MASCGCMARPELADGVCPRSAVNGAISKRGGWIGFDQGRRHFGQKAALVRGF